VLQGWAAFRYGHLARRTPIIGAFMMSAALGVMSILDFTGAVMTYRLDWAASYTNALLAFTIVTSIFIALGMHLLVFEDMTDEIRRTNLALATANEQIKQMAITDPLTGCYNRRFFDEIGRREMQRHRRYGKPLAVVFVDINRFKYLNDRFGHDMGDTVLRTLGGMLRRHVRQSDYVIRWGGDEFLLLLTCTVTEAAGKAEELKAALPSNGTRHSRPTRPSISVAEWSAAGPRQRDSARRQRDVPGQAGRARRTLKLGSAVRSAHAANPHLRNPGACARGGGVGADGRQDHRNHQGPRRQTDQRGHRARDQRGGQCANHLDD
jgi:diguanylate cyclase (GGDEF)-like protein